MGSVVFRNIEIIRDLIQGQILIEMGINIGKQAFQQVRFPFVFIDMRLCIGAAVDIKQELLDQYGNIGIACIGGGMNLLQDP